MAAGQVTVAVGPGGYLDFKKLNVNAQGYLLTAIQGAITGSFSPSGLFNGIRTTKIVVTDVAVQVPLSPYADRNTISIRVMGAKIVYFGNSSVSKDGVETPPASGIFVDAGYPKFQYEEISTDITADPAVEVWAVCAAGETCEVRIMEIG